VTKNNSFLRIPNGTRAKANESGTLIPLRRIKHAHIAYASKRAIS
jgi:hypothetical protein